MIPALIALFLILSGSGAAPFADLVKQFSSASKDAIVEPARRDAARAALKQMAAAIKDHEKSRNETIKAVVRLGESHGATEADYRAIVDAQYVRDAAFQETIIALYAELKAQVSAEEWATLTADLK